jgi:hypothetical protein
VDYSHDVSYGSNAQPPILMDVPRAWVVVGVYLVVLTVVSLVQYRRRDVT